jgi:hypothetical protein
MDAAMPPPVLLALNRGYKLLAVSGRMNIALT